MKKLKNMSNHKILSILGDYDPTNIDYNILVNNFWGEAIIRTAKMFWKKLNLTDGLKEQKAEECAIIFDNLVYKIINDELENLIRHYKDECGVDLEVIIFPLAKRIINNIYNFDVDDFIEFLWNLDLELFSETIDNIILLNDSDNEAHDREAEVVDLLIKIFTNKFRKIY